MDENNKLYIVVNVDWFFLSHRLPIALAAKREGYVVTIVAKDTGKKKEIESYGFNFIDFPFQRSGSNPIHELKCIFLLYRIYKRNKPDVIHHVTLKACLLGSIATKMAKTKFVINAISGFGYNFTDGRQGLKQKLIKSLLKLAFKSNTFAYIFQNPDDINEFSSLNLVSETQIHLIKGSGVDLFEFNYEPEIPKEKIKVILLARMLYDKGVFEFINAAKKIKNKVEEDAEFILVGECDTVNLAGISERDLSKILDIPYIQWIGFQKDIFAILKDSDIVVLPSYREGLPKSLIEACAVGRPIITTDTYGCRECVIDGYNGYLVPVKDTKELAERMTELILNSHDRIRMGKNSRKLAEKEFSLDLVIKKHLAIYKSTIRQ